MKCDKHILRLYAVTDRAWTGCKTLTEQLEAALKNGVTCVQLREKDLNDEAFIAEAIAIKALCSRYHIPLIINDNVKVALACNADGIHIGQEDMSLSEVRRMVGDKMIIGVSAHTVEEAQDAERDGADYLGLGAVFTTSTKTDVDLMPKATLKSICHAVTIPTVAIGGINAGNIPDLSDSGVDGVAVVSAIFAAEDPGAAAAELRCCVEKMVSP